MHGDGVAPETFVEHLDRISLFTLASSMLLLVFAGWQLPSEPDALASICRARPGSAATTTPSPRLANTRSTP